MKKVIAISQDMFDISCSGHIYSSTIKLLMEFCRRGYSCKYFLGNTVKSELAVSGVDVVPYFSPSKLNKLGVQKRVISKCIEKLSLKEKFKLDWTNKVSVTEVLEIIRNENLGVDDIIYFPYILPIDIKCLEKELDKLSITRPRIVYFVWKESMGFYSYLNMRICLRKVIAKIRAGYDIKVTTDSYRYAAAFNKILGDNCFSIAPMMSEIAGYVKLYEKKQTFDVVFLGRVSKDKGFFDLYDIIKKYNEGVESNTYFHIQAGNISIGDVYYREVEKLRTAFDNVDVIAESLVQSRYEELFKSADVLLLPYKCPYYWQGTSGPFAEALAAGLPTLVCMGTWMSSILIPFHNEYCRGMRDNACICKRSASDQWVKEDHSRVMISIKLKSINEKNPIVKLRIVYHGTCIFKWVEIDCNLEGFLILDSSVLKYACEFGVFVDADVDSMKIYELMPNKALTYREDSYALFGICENHARMAQTIMSIKENYDIVYKNFGYIRTHWIKENGVFKMVDYLIE